MSAPIAFHETPTSAQVREQFEALAADWRDQSKYLSNSRQMAMLKPYQRIIGLGRAAVPLILEDLQRDPDHWFWALEAITGESPYQPDTVGPFTAIDVRKAADAWLEWGRRNHLDMTPVARSIV